MKKLVVITLAAVLLLSGVSLAGEIKLKNSFWTGWKYSMGGLKYHKVGFSGQPLRLAMEGNDQAQAEMDIYKKRKVLGAITGWPGGFMMGWVMADAMFGDWNSTDNIMLAVGVPLVIVSAFSEASATRHLKEAVSIYNGEDQALLFDVNFRKSVYADNGTIMLGLKYRF